MTEQKTIHFGTDGIRGNGSQFPFTNHALTILGSVVATWCKKKYKNTLKPQILLGHDTRASCDRIKKALIKGLSQESLTIVDAGSIPTPAIFKILQTNHLECKIVKTPFNLGIVISASHNPAHDNGIKFFDAEQGKLTPEDEKELEQAFYNAYQTNTQTEALTYTTATNWPNAQQLYIHQIAKHFTPNFLIGKTIVLDCAHGATSAIAPLLFKQLGANVIALFAQPNGTNINQNCGAVHPEIVAAATREHNAYAGFAFDGDGDRVIAVNNRGEIKDGDDILAILLENNEFKTTKTVVGTLMTNHGFEVHLATHHKNLIRTRVGDKYIAAAMEQEQLPLGGETSGHIIIAPYLMSGDGIFTALKLLQTMLAHNNHEMNSFTKYPQLLLNIPITHKNDLTAEPFASFIKNYQAKHKHGRIVIRYSDTESLLRIMTEAATHEDAQKMAQTLATDFMQLCAPEPIKTSLNTPISRQS